MIFQQYGAAALLINFEQKIQQAINEQVIDLNNAILATKLPGITYTIPAYCSLTIGYNPEEVSYDTLCLLIKNLKVTDLENIAPTKNRLLNIPVCYEEEFGLDLSRVAKEKECSIAEIIQLHTTTPFRVYMLGFLPGFAYMGRLPEALACQRRQTPRVRIPERSVGLAGYQTGIYPSVAPGGWQIIGQTPIPTFRPNQNPMFLFQAGDQVQFQAISKKDFHAILKDIDRQHFNWSSIYA